MEDNNTTNKQDLSFFGLLNGIIFHPVKTWDKITEKNYFKYMWPWFFIITGFSVFSANVKTIPNFIITIFLMYAFVWIAILILWAFIQLGLKISGVNTAFSFLHIMRLYTYNSLISVVFLPLYIISTLFLPKVKGIFSGLESTSAKISLQIGHEIIFAASLIWFTILLIVSVKKILNISYKRAVLSVIILPFCMFLFISSIFILTFLF